MTSSVADAAPCQVFDEATGIESQVFGEAMRTNTANKSHTVDKLEVIDYVSPALVGSWDR